MLNDKCTICNYELKHDDCIDIPDDCIPEINANSITNSTKLTKIIEIVEDVKSKNEKVLIFSQWATFIKIISNKLNEFGVGNTWIDGTCTQEKRKTNIAKFKDNANTVVFLAT